MFINRFCRSVRKLFDNSMDLKESDNRSKSDDNTSTDEFKDCDDCLNEEVVIKEDNVNRFTNDLFESTSMAATSRFGPIIGQMLMFSFI